MTFIDHLNMTVAPPQGYTVEHHGGAGDKSRTRAINKQQGEGGGGDATDCYGGTALEINSPSNTSKA